MRYATCDIDETLVPDWMILGARAGSNQAKEALRVYVNGQILVKAIKQINEDLTVVSLRELCQLGAVKSVTIGESK
jgi:hypothetical protein